ncbi:MAG: hypothetical protein ABII25_01535 [bacterium]
MGGRGTASPLRGKISPFGRNDKLFGRNDRIVGAAGDENTTDKKGELC